MNTKNEMITPMLTDFYQLTMAYAYWKSDRHEEEAVFDLFFRKNPFQGEFTVFAGLEEILRYVKDFRFTQEQIAYLKTIMPGCDDEFFDWLARLDCSKVKIYAIDEGRFVFPREPLITVKGPLAICQILETTMLNLVNFASLIATNAARFRLAAGMEKILLEFGLRRAQGPDGAMSASRYSVLGGFDGTSNVQAGQFYGLTVKGTHAHAFVQSFSSLDELNDETIMTTDGKIADFVEMVLKVKDDFGFTETNEGELAAFIAYAQAFPSGFLALVDTYDTLRSGVPNYICVAVALLVCGYKPVGIRLDSGDLAYLSKKAKEMFVHFSEKFGCELEGSKIVASNDINEAILHSLNEQGHEIDVYGVGTNLVTCQAQPALGCVYKLVEIKGKPRIKLSQEVGKVTIPGAKRAYRLYGKDNFPIIDLMQTVDEPAPVVGERVLCRHPFMENKRAYVVPRKVECLHKLAWFEGELKCDEDQTTHRKRVMEQLSEFREDHLRAQNPTPYKVAVSNELYEFIHNLWSEEAPIKELI